MTLIYSYHTCLRKYLEDRYPDYMIVNSDSDIEEVIKKENIILPCDWPWLKSHDIKSLIKELEKNPAKNVILVTKKPDFDLGYLNPLRKVIKEENIKLARSFLKNECEDLDTFKTLKHFTFLTEKWETLDSNKKVDILKLINKKKGRNTYLFNCSVEEKELIQLIMDLIMDFKEKRCTTRTKTIKITVYCLKKIIKKFVNLENLKLTVKCVSGYAYFQEKELNSICEELDVRRINTLYYKEDIELEKTMLWFLDTSNKEG